jgi:transposase-like protein
MNPKEQFCHNPDCPDRGKVNAGNISIHGKKDKRYRCKTCGKTFSATKGTAAFGLKKNLDLFVLVTTLMAHGCPIQAIVMAFGLDERTVKDWLHRAGAHCEQVHEHMIGSAKWDIGHGQGDEIKVKTQKGSFWMAMFMMVPTRLWLGGVVSAKRDKPLIRTLMGKVRQIALCRPLVIAVDGLSSYVKAIQAEFRSPLRTGKAGRPRMISWPDVAIVQVIKSRSKGQPITRRIVQGCPEMIQRLLGGGSINTAYIERLNATFRQRLACLARRTRALARTPDTLKHGMYLVGCVYNFCSYHKSLRLPLYVVSRRRGQCRRWVQRTPAMATGLTDHQWSVEELLLFKVPLPAYVAPKRRGRPPKIAALGVAA